LALSPGAVSKKGAVNRVSRSEFTTTRQPGAILAAPFRGEWLVVNGGPSSLINLHYDYPNQRHTLDIERLVIGRERTDSGYGLASCPSWWQTLYSSEMRLAFVRRFRRRANSLPNSMPSSPAPHPHLRQKYFGGQADLLPAGGRKTFGDMISTQRRRVAKAQRTTGINSFSRSLRLCDSASLR
jgi:hypothetical protein